MNLIKTVKQASLGQIAFTLIVLAILVRFPFFFNDFIDRDESTFILMGNSWVNGYLPFTQLWDLKSPLTFGYFAIMISIFGKSLFAIRLGGAIIVGLIGVFTYLISKQFFNRITSLLAGILSIYLISLFDTLQGVMSEHLVVLPLIIGLYLLIKSKSKLSLFFVGLCFGIALMTRINQGIPILILLAFVFAQWIYYKQTWFTNTLIISIGILLPTLILGLVYNSHGELQLFIDSVFLAPLNYSKASLDKILHILPTILILSTVTIFSYIKLTKTNQSRELKLLFVLIIGEIIMLLKGGKINGHYLIQIYPFIAITFVALISSFIPYRPENKWVKIPVYILLILLPTQSYKGLFKLAKHATETNSLYNGTAFKIADYIKPEKNVFFLNEHIAYWFLDALPPSPVATHPSNIFRGFNYKYVKGTHENPLKEMEFILEVKKPKFIVFNPKRLPMPKDQDYHTYFNEYLDMHYILDITIEKCEIYRRR